MSILRSNLLHIFVSSSILISIFEVIFNLSICFMSEITFWMWCGAIGIKQVYRELRSLVRLPAMDDFSKDGFSGNHIPLISVLISVLICIISIDKKYFYIITYEIE